MIDTIKAELIVTDLGNLNGEEYEVSKKETKYGNYRNYLVKNINISVKELNGKYRLRIKGGSLSKFLYNTNLVKFTREDVEKSINKLGNLINIDIGEATLSRVDIAGNINLSQPVSSYLILLASHKKSKFTSINSFETVVFYTKGLALSFYDKKKEIQTSKKIDKNDKKAIASFLSDMNILRYELQIKKMLAKYNNGEQMKLKDLYNKDRYKQLVKLWYQNYLWVEKDNMASFKPSKEFKDYLFYNGIVALGGIQKTMVCLSSWFEKFHKELNPKSRANKKSKLKKSILELNRSSKKHALIKELDRKIKFEKEFFL